MKAKDLMNINAEVIKMINDHIDKHNMNLSQFAKESGVHQSQLWLYMNTNKSAGLSKGLHTNTLEKIGTYLSKKK
jgi:predicted XRE-type DNA-binding protein